MNHLMELSAFIMGLESKVPTFPAFLLVLFDFTVCYFRFMKCNTGHRGMNANLEYVI